MGVVTLLTMVPKLKCRTVPVAIVGIFSNVRILPVRWTYDGLFFLRGFS